MLGSHTFLSTLFSIVLILYSFLNVRDLVSHPYKTTGKIVVVCILIFMFLGSKREDRTSGLNSSMHSLNSVCRNSFRHVVFIC